MFSRGLPEALSGREMCWKLRRRSGPESCCRWSIGRVRLGQLELQVIREGIVGLILSKPQLVGCGRAGLQWRREVCRFDFRRGAVCLKRRLHRRGSIRQRLPGTGLRALDLRRVGAGGVRFLMQVSGSRALAERGARREEEKRDDPVWRSSRHPSLFPRCSKRGSFGACGRLRWRNTVDVEMKRLDPHLNWMTELAESLHVL